VRPPIGRKRKRQRSFDPWRSAGVLPVRQITHRPIRPGCAEPGSPRSPRLPPQPVMRCRTRWLRRRPHFELPRSSILWSLPAMDIRGDSNLASSALPAVTRRVSPAFTLPAAPYAQTSGCPSSCAFRLLPATSFEAIRRGRPSAAPTERFRVAPYRVRSVSPKTSLRVSPHLRPPAPVDEPAESPRLIHPPASPERISGSPRIFFDLWLLRRSWPQFRPGASVLRRRRRPVPRFAPIPCPSACRLSFPGSPRFGINGWVDDESRCSRTLHPRLAPRMNLRVQSSSQPCLTCDAVSICPGPPLSASRPRTPVTYRSCIVWPDPVAV